MWPKKDTVEKLDFAGYVGRLREAGFTAEDRGGGVLITKHGCGAVLEASASGEPRFAAGPGLLAGNRIAYLLDKGYQKFWQADNLRFPALAEQLRSLHDFDQDLRAVMGLTSLYNESLGTVSARYVYDRLEGREDPKRHKPF